MLKLGSVTKVKVFFLVLCVFNNDLFEFSAAVLEKGLLVTWEESYSNCLP